MTDQTQHAETPPAGLSPPPSGPIPKGPRLWAILLLLVVAAGALAVGVSYHQPLRDTYARLYNALTGKAATTATAPAAAAYYTCGMHPWVVLPAPGPCPICHMDLVPLDPAKFTEQLAIDPVISQNIGMRVSPVVSGPVTRVIRTVGAVDYDETRLGDVTTKTAGWLEKLYADYVGKPVEKGQKLFDLYSPELYAAQEEYLAALRTRGRVAPEFVSAPDLVEASRKRLENLDVGASQIEALEKSGKSSRTLAVASPFAGLVIDKKVLEGMKVEPGMMLYRIADLSKVWVMVSLYENQLPFVSVGQQAAMTLPYLPGKTYAGKVAYIYPYLNEESRQLKLRLEFDNPGLSLKPGMFANVELQSTLASNRTLVPREAVLDTGQRQVAFVSLGGGRFDPRTVRLGVEAQDGLVEVLDGLKPGEMVVTNGQFLLDSESRLREALARLVKGTPAVEQAGAGAPTGATELKSLPGAAAKDISAVLDAYFRLWRELTDDSTKTLAEPARALAAAGDELSKTTIPQDEHFWHRHDEVATASGKALELADEKDLPAAREKFADLSIALSKLLRATGVPPSYGKQVEELHCPMYRPGQGGNIWLQPAGGVLNPFYGAASNMKECFDRRYTLRATGAAGATTAPAASPPAPGAPAVPAGHQH